MNKQKVFHFTKLLGSTFLLQALVQACGMLVGFYIVRMLSVQEYAYYTIANSMLVLLNIISDSGVSTAVFALGGKVWQDKEKLGSVMNTAIAFRNKFALVSLVLGLPFVVYMLMEQSIPITTIILIILAFIPSFKSQLTDGLYEMVPKLHQDLKILQKNQIMVAVFRVFLTGVALFVFPFTWVALLANGIPRMYGNIRLRHIVKERADLTQPQETEYKKEITRIVKRSFPGVVYFAFSGQISLFIMSFMGKTNNIAQWGALGRYTVIYTIFSMVVGLVLMPRYARKENVRSILLINSFQILFLTLIGGSVIIGLTYIFSDQLLLLLGKEYQGLSTELIVSMLNGLIGIFGGLAINFTLRKGWIIHPAIDLAINIVPMVLFAYLIPFNSLLNVLLYGTAVALFNFLAHYIAFFIQLFKYTK